MRGVLHLAAACAQNRCSRQVRDSRPRRHARAHQWRGMRDPRFIAVKSNQAAERVVRDHVRARYDMIKVIQRIDLSIYRHLLTVARSAQLPVVGHIVSKVGLTRSLEASQISIEHSVAFVTSHVSQRSLVRTTKGSTRKPLKSFGPVPGLGPCFVAQWRLRRSTITSCSPSRCLETCEGETARGHRCGHRAGACRSPLETCRLRSGRTKCTCRLHLLRRRLPCPATRNPCWKPSLPECDVPA
jgi:hypothetical protein